MKEKTGYRKGGEKMKKKSLTIFAVFLVFFCSVGVANSSLIGDGVLVQHLYPDLNTTTYITSVQTVAVGDSDLVVVYRSDNTGLYNVNLEADSVYVNFLFSGAWVPSTFNGLRLLSLEDDSGNPLQGVSVTTNMTGYMAQWDASRITFGDDWNNWVAFNWNGLLVSDTTFFNATFDYDVDPIPIPGAVWLLGSGLAGLFALRRIKK